MHEAAPVQDSQKSCPVGTRGLGLGVIDQPVPEALAGVAKVPTKSTVATSKIDLFIAIPPGAPRRSTLHWNTCTLSLPPAASRWAKFVDFKVGFGQGRTPLPYGGLNARRLGRVRQRQCRGRAQPVRSV
jgi:hypothetical protein